VTKRLAAPFDLGRMLHEVTQAATRLLRAERASVWLLDRTSDELVLTISADSAPRRIPVGSGLAGACARERRPVCVNDCYADPRFNPATDRATGFRTTNSLSLPLIDHDDALVGVLQVLNAKSGTFDAADIALAEALSAQCAVALTRVRLVGEAIEAGRMRQALELARVMQAGTLPRSWPDLPDYDLHAHFQPAEQTGGDTYDLALVDDKLLIVLADATGHGIAPALSVTQMQAMLRTGFGMRGGLEAVFHLVNDQMHAVLPDGHFVTAFVGILDPATHVLRFISGGQAPIVHWQAATQEMAVHKANSFPLGSMPLPRAKTPVELSLAPGDALVLLSDGIYETEDAVGELFGRARVEALLREGAGDGMAALAERILGAAQRHGQGQPQADDITLVLVARRPAADTPPSSIGHAAGLV
jgi:sigma-B regulation protein RsbU (phosphoserine phosphatase)